MSSGLNVRTVDALRSTLTLRSLQLHQAIKHAPVLLDILAKSLETSERSMCWASVTAGGFRFLCYCRVSLPPVATASYLLHPFTGFRAPGVMDHATGTRSYSFSASSHSGRRRGGKGLEIKDNRERSRGGGGGKDKIDALGRLLTRVLRHMTSELNLNIRSDGYVRVQDLLKLNMKTFANIPLRAHTVDDIREAVRKDNKQRFSLLEDNGELLIRANQGHTIVTVETESLLKPILSAEEIPGEDSFKCHTIHWS
ncbi:uncharacterized protein LOC127801167 isoform X2 [Diospyros lotus]|uniref:uncharacterized protein LOC127801167 isoform X2 n=1 Tax=Diospyros lotus TaxID=55363 RepID=UPI00224E8392|nr:uncharacterized protein LOC127801167 isoform X2 [Diospyros lotus]